MVGIRGSGIVSSAADVLWMSGVRGMRGVGGVCEMSMCLARGGVGGEGGAWMRELGLGFTNPVETGGSVSVSLLCWCRWGEGRGLDKGLEWWGGVMCVSCESGFSV